MPHVEKSSLYGILDKYYLKHHHPEADIGYDI